MHLMESRCLTESATREKLVKEFKEVNRKIREVGQLKSKNRISEQQQRMTELKESFQSFRNISMMSGVSLKTVHG